MSLFDKFENSKSKHANRLSVEMKCAIVYLKSRGLSQSEIAERVGCHKRSVSNFLSKLDVREWAASVALTERQIVRRAKLYLL